jgi:hypothetical protein
MHRASVIHAMNGFALKGITPLQRSTLRDPEASDPLICPNGVKHSLIQRQRLTDPGGQRRVVSTVVVSERMNQRRKSGVLDERKDAGHRIMVEMDFELRPGMRACSIVTEFPDEQHTPWVFGMP